MVLRLNFNSEVMKISSRKKNLVINFEFIRSCKTWTKVPSLICFYAAKTADLKTKVYFSISETFAMGKLILLHKAFVWYIHSIRNQAIGNRDIFFLCQAIWQLNTVNFRVKHCHWCQDGSLRKLGSKEKMKNIYLFTFTCFNRYSFFNCLS